MGSRMNRLDALKKGNRTRSREAERKAAIRRGEVDLVALVESGESLMSAYDFLKSIPRCGPVKAQNALRACHISWHVRLGGPPRSGRKILTDRQRKALAAYVAANTKNGRWKTA